MRSTRLPTRLIATGCALACVAVVSKASAAPPWVERGLTLPRHDWAFDFGLGIGHFDQPFLPSPTGAGVNVEGAVGITENLELGLRTGIRFGNDGEATHADEYGRLFDRQTFDTYGDPVADPEFRIRGRLVHTQVVELALEGRAAVPIEGRSRFGAQFGVPLLFHIGRSVRLDTGAYVPVIFTDVVSTMVSAPIDVWIQASNRLWLGPMSGLRFHNPNGQVDVSAGFGLGYQITGPLDFKTMILFPRINDTAGGRNFGLGAGIQIRIE